MKKIVLLLCFIQFVLMAKAGDVTPEEARQIAQEFLISHRSSTPGGPRQVREEMSLTLQESDKLPLKRLHVFNCGDNRGYVIVSGDDRTVPILGYADKGSFDPDHMPDNMRSWLEGYAEQISQLDVCGIQQSFDQPAVTSTRHALAPLMKSKWGQRAPYNNLCPVDPNTNELSAAGCVAVAMAQVMYYHRYPERTVGTIPGYSIESSGISLPAIDPTSIDWTNILPSYISDDVTAEQANAVAQLMLLCGTALNMNYSSSGSSASDEKIAYLLATYFDYDAGGRFLKRSGKSTEEWESIIYNELANGRPVIYTGTRDRQGSDSSHAFVLDGYDDRGYYHVNWGWTGNSDGYFLLSILSPYATSEQEQLLSNEGYQYNHSAVIGIQPNVGGQPEPYRMTTNEIYLTEDVSVLYRASKTENFPAVSITCSTYNFTGGTVNFDVGIGLVNDKGDLVPGGLFANDVTLDYCYGWGGRKINYSFGKNLEDGDYRIVLASREHGKDQMLLNKNSEYYYIEARISNNKLKLRNATISLSGEITMIGDVEAKKMNKIQASVHNDGTVFHSPVYLLIDGKSAGARYIDLAADETKSMEMGFTIEEAGEHTISLAYYWGQEFHTFATQTIQVAPPAINQLTLSLLSTNATAGVVGPTLKMTVLASNTNTAAYDNKILAKLYRYRHDGSNIGDWADESEKSVYIPVGSKKEVDFQFDNLIDGERYFVWIYYYSEGEAYKDGRLFGGNYNVDIPDAIELTPADQQHRSVIYDLQGRPVQHPTKGSLYIIDGHKVLMK